MRCFIAVSSQCERRLPIVRHALMHCKRRGWRDPENTSRCVQCAIHFALVQTPMPVYWRDLGAHTQISYLGRCFKTPCQLGYSCHSRQPPSLVFWTW
jgi:hypothetical protein